MNNLKFFRNTALAFGLLAAGSSFADEPSTTPPVTPGTGPAATSATEIRSEMASMTPEQRVAFRKEMETKMSSMTPAQREAFRQQIRSQMANTTPAQRAASLEQANAERPDNLPAHADMRQDHMNPSEMRDAASMRAR